MALHQPLPSANSTSSRRFRERSPSDRIPFKKNEFHVGDREARSPIRRHSRNNSHHATERLRLAAEARRNGFFEHMRNHVRPNLPTMEPDPNQLSSSESLSRMMQSEDQRDRPAQLSDRLDRMTAAVHRSEQDRTRRWPQSNRFRPLGLRRRESGLLPRRTLSQLSSEEQAHLLLDGEERTDTILHFDFAPAYRYSRTIAPADENQDGTTPSAITNHTGRLQRHMDEYYDSGLTLDGTRSPLPAARTPAMTVNPTSGLGDRRRSLSPEFETEYENLPELIPGDEEQDNNPILEEENWTSLLRTIPPDEHLPSASSSFTSSNSNRNSSQPHNASPHSTDITVPSTRANSANSTRNDPINASPYICPDPPTHHPRPHPTTGALHPRRRRRSLSDHRIVRPEPPARPRSRSPVPSSMLPRTPILHHYPRRDLTRRDSTIRNSPYVPSSSSVASISRLERSVEATNARRERHLASLAARDRFEINHADIIQARVAVMESSSPARRSTTSARGQRERARQTSTETPAGVTGQSETQAADASMDNLDEIRERIVPSAYSSLVNARDARDRLEDHLNRFEHLDSILTRMERQEHVPDEMWVQAGLTPGLGRRVGMTNGNTSGRGAERL